MDPIFETNYLGFWIKVYPNRLEFKAGTGTQNIPINQIASVELGMIGLMKITVETAGGRKYDIPCLKKKEVKEAIYKAQDSFGKPPTSNTSVTDELVKLAELKEKGILSEEEFQQQKKKLLQ